MRHEAFLLAFPLVSKFGFPLPAKAKLKVDIAGYHCWARFHLPGALLGSGGRFRAWKNPAQTR